MKNLPYLKQSKVNELRNKIKDNFDLYLSGEIDSLIKDRDYHTVNNVLYDDELLSEINKKHSEVNDAKNSLLVYEAFPNLTPHLARDERIWTFFTHKDCSEYSFKRWDLNSVKQEKQIEFIKNHAFAQNTRKIVRGNALSRLWWTAYITADIEGYSHKEALNAVFSDKDIRGQILERPTAYSDKKLHKAIIGEIIRTYKVKPRESIREAIKSINFIAGAKLVQFMSDNEVKEIVREQFAAS